MTSSYDNRMIKKNIVHVWVNSG